ncbi:MAG: aminotransferase DegT [Nitrospirae bacterium]|nr:MAG: aminotransferase DegT [Nitrospirota bacterium]
MRNKVIQLDAPNIGEREKEFLIRAVESGYVSTAGPLVAEFEAAFAGLLGTKKAASTQSGTAALHMALYELGIGKGDEVIVPATTFAATVNPVLYVGATPVIADVDVETWTLSPESVESNLTGRTKAVIPVHLYGVPCRMDEIMGIAEKHGLKVVEDATESLCSRYKGEFTGTFGDMGCFSFNGNKTITTGGGGMVVSREEQCIEHIKFLINQARDESAGYYHPEVGFNYRMTNLEAALGLAQMGRLEEFVAKKRRFNKIYREELSGCGFIRFQQGPAFSESSWWLTCILFEKDTDIPELQLRLKSEGVPARRVFMPLGEMPPYASFVRNPCGNAALLYERGLCLPSSTLNSDDDIRHVCKILRELI